MAACGLWLSKHRLVAAVVDEDGRTEPTTLAAADDDERWALLQYVVAVHGIDCALVLPEDLLRADAICHIALGLGHDLWTVPRALVEAIRRAARITTAARVAAMLARLPLVPGFRGHLRRIDRSAYDRRQLLLL
jgi:hypothetical protein